MPSNNKPLIKLSILVIVFAILNPLLIQDGYAQSGAYAEISNMSYQEAEEGVWITFELNVYNMLNTDILVGMWPIDSSNDQFVIASGSNSDFQTPSGLLVSSDITTPSYQHTVWESFQLYLPYDSFPRGETSWYPYIEVRNNSTGEHILSQSSYFDYFVLNTMAGSASAPIDYGGSGSNSGDDCSPSYKYSYQTNNLACVKSIVVMVHGVNTSKSVYSQWVEGFFTGPNAPGFGLDKTIFVQVNWESDALWQASDQVGGRANSVTGMSDRAFFAVWKLKQTVARLKYLFPETPISIVAHSQGTIVTLTALQEGMTVDNWILMGSPLDQEIVAGCESGENVDFNLATNNVNETVWNLWSSLGSYGDYVAVLKGGIGTFGLQESCAGGYNYNVYDTEVQGVGHFGDNSWWDYDHFTSQITPDAFSSLLNILQGGDLHLVGYTQDDMNFFSEYIYYWAMDKPMYRTSTEEDSYIYWELPDNDYDSFSEDLLLPKGMLTGWYMDDKDRVEYTLTCVEGSAFIRTLEARWDDFDRSNDWVFVNEGYYVSDDHSVDREWYGGKYDATMWVQVINTEHNGISRCTLVMQGIDD